MKKLLLTFAAVGFILVANAQNRPADISIIKQNLSRQSNVTTSPYMPVISGNEAPVNKTSQTVRNYVSNTNKSSQVQTLIGSTTYDLQSNGSVQNRIYKKNGNVGAVWTFSTDLAGTYPDRGAGYNYFDGTNWGSFPTTAIETDRRGWPSLLQLANGSEVVVSHQSATTSTATNIRPTAGSGAWTQTLCPTFPGGEPTLWVRTAAGGPDGNTVHMIDISYPTLNGGPIINGLDGALNYSRSLDGGNTWDIVRVEPVGADSTLYDGFRADGYAIDAKDDIVAFTSGNIDSDWALWKSTDNGATFTKTIIFDFPFTKYDDATQITDVDGDGVADTVLTTDGAYAIIIDNGGMVHAFAGAMLILDEDPAGLLGLFLSTDGLLYWNESMGSAEPVVIATAPDLDGDGVAATFALDLGGRYGNDGICSMPSAAIDAAGNLYVSYCPLIETTDNGGVSPTNFSYRNVYLKASVDGGITWGDGYNVSNSFFDEAVFNSLARDVDNCVSMIWQQDGDPGYSVPPNGEHFITFNDIVYECVDVNMVLGINDQVNQNVSVSIFPNPAVDNITLSYNVEEPVELTIEIRNVLGQVVETMNKNIQNTGTFNVLVDVSEFSSGVYTANTIIGNNVTSTKFMKK